MPASPPALELAFTAAEAADDVKASDLIVIDVADLLAIAETFLVAGAASDRQLGAVVDRIERRLAEDGRKPLRREGSPASGWMLLDYGDLVCQLFTTDERATFALERLWGDVPQYDGLTRERIEPGVSRTPRASLDAS